MTDIPWELLADYIKPDAVKNADGSPAAAVAMIFLPRCAPIQCFGLFIYYIGVTNNTFIYNLLIEMMPSRLSL